MSRFVRIDKQHNPKKAVLLNLDLVATVELSAQSELLSAADEKRILATFLAYDRTVLGSIHFEHLEAAHGWVASYLGVQM